MRFHDQLAAAEARLAGLRIARSNFNFVVRSGFATCQTHALQPFPVNLLQLQLLLLLQFACARTCA